MYRVWHADRFGDNDVEIAAGGGGGFGDAEHSSFGTPLPLSVTVRTSTAAAVWAAKFVISLSVDSLLFYRAPKSLLESWPT